MSKKKSNRSHSHAESKHSSSEHSSSEKRSGGFLKFLIRLVIVLLIIGGGLYYIYMYQPEKWNAGANWINERLNMGENKKSEITVDFDKIKPADEGIPEEYFKGHTSAGGEISQADAQKKMIESAVGEFRVSEEDVVMAWPEKLPAGEWIWESEVITGAVGKMASDAWLFWVDKSYGSMYPHPTYYVVVYGDGFVDVFVGSFTPKVGNDDWLNPGTKAKLVQGSLELS